MPTEPDGLPPMMTPADTAMFDPAVRAVADVEKLTAWWTQNYPEKLLKFDGDAVAVTIAYLEEPGVLHALDNG